MYQIPLGSRQLPTYDLDERTSHLLIPGSFDELTRSRTSALVPGPDIRSSTFSLPGIADLRNNATSNAYVRRDATEPPPAN